MKVHIANYQERIGGGWSQARYLAKGLGNADYEEADVYLICGASMVSHGDVEKAKADGKKIVLRVDNHLLASRNRNTGMSRLKAFSSVADLIVYQSEWSREYLKPYLGVDGAVILNGVDLNIFNSKNRANTKDVLYVRSSRIAEKGWEMARYKYSVQHAKHQDIGKLNIVGKFSGENIEYNFDFYNNENYLFLGEQPQESLAYIMKQSRYFLYSYFMDACSNTLLEARASGMSIVDVYGMLETGGAPEIMACEDISIERMIDEYKKEIEKL